MTHPLIEAAPAPPWYDWRATLGRLFLRHPAARYGFAIGMVAATTALLVAMPIRLDLGTVQLLYVLAVLATAVVSGFGPAIIAAALGFVTINFFFVLPRYTLRVDRPKDVFRLIEFWVAALLSGALASYARHQTDRAERRVLEITTLHTLTRAIEAESTVEGRLAQIAETTATLLALPFCAISLVGPAAAGESPAVAWGDREAVRDWLTVPIRQDDAVIGQLQAGLPAQRSLAADEHHLLRLITTQLLSVLDHARMLDAAAQARALQETDRLKSAILSSLSHDLRTPLTTIQGAVSELKATDVAWTAATRVQLLDAIDGQTQRLRRVVSNLLDLSKLRAGALLPHADWYALDEIIYHALDSLRDLLDGHSVTVQAPADLPLARLDFVLTEQVFANLFQNAVQHGAPDTALRITIAAEGDRIACQVANTGAAIPLEWHERIFEPFVRASGAPPTSLSGGTGSGLGLAICKGFMEAQGGSIRIDPTVRDGVAIWVIVPVDHQRGHSVAGTA